jgi:hypothetical protein
MLPIVIINKELFLHGTDIMKFRINGQVVSSDNDCHAHSSDFVSSLGQGSATLAGNSGANAFK